MAGGVLESVRQKLTERPDSDKRQRPYRTLSILALIALVIQSGLLFLALFEPGLPYVVTKRVEGNDSDQYLRTLEALTGAQLYRRTRAEVLTNGPEFYAAELEAIGKAQRTINLEAYIFEEGEIGKRFVDALTRRARAGVRVNILFDAIGSKSYPERRLSDFKEARGRIAWYHGLKWYTWPRLNNRTHRELLIVDGRVGFIGGAGVADSWYKQVGDEPRWRDTMVRVEGEAVTGLQAVFAENWLESTGEILLGAEYFPFPVAAGNLPALVLGSAPTTGRSTPARVLFQTLVASARKSIYITNPYFLPDRSMREELARAARERGVDVKVVVPGKWNDHLMTRRASRRIYGELLQAGVRIYEYQPSMMHAKILVVDGLWSIVGSTNMDSRSFGLNDEANLAAKDLELAERLQRDFFTDITRSREISYDRWRSRPVWERVHEWFGWVLERQQ
jgi:cardiolipin synthase